MPPVETALRAGAAEVDITPALGTHMGGDACRLRPVDKILDPLYARALVVEDGRDERERVCLLSLDLCTPGDDASDEIRGMLADRFGFDTGAVMLHLLQNHSAPSLGTHQLMRPDSPYARRDFWWLYEGDAKYFDNLKPKLIAVVEQAISRLEEVELACGGMADGRVAHNRRFVMRDGSVQSPAADPAEILHVEGPVDPEVGVAGFRSRDGRMIAAVLHHTAHPVSHFHTNWVTASWPGAWARQFRAVAGPDCIPIVVNGACGNIDAANLLDEDFERDDERIGEQLTQTATRVLERLTWRPGGAVGFATATIDFPFEPVAKTVGPEAIEQARRVLAAEPEPRWTNDERTAVDVEWAFASVLLDLDRRSTDGRYEYEVQAFRIGDLGLVGITGEPFVEGQLTIKRDSPAARTFVGHMCNGWIGYIPPAAAHRATNYTFRTPEGQPVRRGASLFLLPADALERITDKSVELLRGLFGERG